MQYMFCTPLAAKIQHFWELVELSPHLFIFIGKMTVEILNF